MSKSTATIFVLLFAIVFKLEKPVSSLFCSDCGMCQGLFSLPQRGVHKRDVLTKHMTYVGIWWYMVVYDGIVVVYGGIWWYYGGIWWYMVVLWWYMVVYGGIMVVYGGICISYTTFESGIN